MLKFWTVLRLMSERGEDEVPVVRDKARRNPDEAGKSASKCTSRKTMPD